MWVKRASSVLFSGVVLFSAFCAEAASNPALDALAQGSVVQFSGKEAVSEPFAFDVTIATKDKALNVGLAVGQPLTIAVAPGRSLSGMVESIEQVDSVEAQGLYRLRIAPGLNRLKYESTSRTFANMNPVQIITALLNEAGITNMEFRIAAALPTREITVQYHETDLAFLSRLLEEAGVHYHFESSPGGDKVVFGDSNAGFPVAPAGKLAFATSGPSALSSFSRGLSLHPGQVQAGDYNWKAPAADLSAVAQVAVFGDLVERLFPAGIEKKVDAQTAANIRLAARIADAQRCGGESGIPQLQAGQRVVLAGHPRADFNQEYVITEVEHRRTGREYRNSFRCLPAQVAYRPLPVTPKPVIGGVVSGIVVGPPGETKHVDQFGRIKVRFPWRSPAHSTAGEPGDGGFIRVAQIAAGAASAALWLPDVGDEVLVAFEHGDPDRPVVVGSLYNAKDMPPVPLPANKHLSLLRTQAANGQKAELVYDATAGNERLLLQSGGQVLTLAASGITLQGSTVTINAGTDVVQRAGRAIVTEAAGDLTVKSGQNLAITSQRDAAVTVGANLQVSVGANTVVDNGKDLSVRAGQNFLLQTQRSARLTVGEDLLIQTAKSLVANSGAMFQFVAAQTGTLKTGSAVLNLQQDGDVNIQGKDIAVLSSGNLTMKSTGNVTLKGSKILQN